MIDFNIHYIIPHPSGAHSIGFRCGCSMHTEADGSIFLRLLYACGESHDSTYLRWYDPLKRHEPYFPRPQG